jgi:NAD(P)-dependent dehydrogenase (short-subunit alcohol dehydrogenase family)
MEIRGKVAVITGAGSGIGRATSLRLGADGASILVADVDETGGAETVKLIEKDGGRAMFVRADVTIESDARNMIDTAVARLGGLDILYNNAGIGTGIPGFPEASLPQWRRVVDIDLTAVIMGTWIAAPIMQKRGGGAIINTASMAGLYPHRQDPVYGAVKAGVVNFTHSCAPWASERKIRVNCVCPGIVDTPMVRRGLEAATRAGLKSWAPAKMLNPNDIADAVVRLIRDESLFGCSLEVRPSGPHIVDPRPAPGLKR